MSVHQYAEYWPWSGMAFNRTNFWVTNSWVQFFSQVHGAINRSLCTRFSPLTMLEMTSFGTNFRVPHRWVQACLHYAEYWPWSGMAYSTNFLDYEFLSTKPSVKCTRFSPLIILGMTSLGTNFRVPILWVQLCQYTMPSIGPGVEWPQLYALLGLRTFEYATFFK